MEKPATPNALPQDKNSSSSTQKRKLLSAQELISQYESQGLDTQQASIKVIEELQSALFRVISSGRNRKDKLMIETSKKIDVTNTRLAVLDMKVDSKPGFGETFAIGVASGVTLKGIGSVMPHVLGGLAQIWNSLWNVPKSSP